MNSVIIDIDLLRYILNSQYNIISIYLITRFNEQHDYEYWTNNIYFELKIYCNSPISIITLFMEPRD